MVADDLGEPPVDWLIVCPLGLERRTVFRALAGRFAWKKRAANFWQASSEGITLGLLQCGVGPERAAAETERLLQSRSVHRLLLLGLGGALADDLAVGTAVVASQSVAETEPLPVDLIQPCVSFDLLSRPLLAASRPVCSADEKHRLGQETGAAFVDMESAGLVRVAAAAHIPLAIVRVISDNADMSLPADVSEMLLPNGEIALFSAVRMVFRPILWSELRKLQRTSNQALRTLSRIASEIDWKILADSFEPPGCRE